MVILLYTAKAAPPASINWDALTAIDTLALAVVTLLTLAYPVRTTGRARKQAAIDWEDAGKRLEDERTAGERRIQDERAAATKRAAATAR